MYRIEKIKELKHLLVLTEAQTYMYCVNQLKPELTSALWLFKKGDPNTTIMLVAHLDTVGSPTPEQLVHDNRVLRTDGTTPLGADDRAGIFAALQVYRKAKIKPHILFTCQEESGGVGAKDFAKYSGRKELVKGVRLMVEFDRKGASDYINYNGKFDDELDTYLNSFGYEDAHGSYSDVASIAPAVGIPGVNLSCGYYRQHTNREILRLDELQMGISRVMSMISTPPPLTKYHDKPTYKYGGTGYYYGGKSGSAGKSNYGGTGYWSQANVDARAALALANKTRAAGKGKDNLIGFNPSKDMARESQDKEEHSLESIWDTDVEHEIEIDTQDADTLNDGVFLTDTQEGFSHRSSSLLATMRLYDQIFDEDKGEHICGGCMSMVDFCTCGMALALLVGYLGDHELEDMSEYLEDTPLGLQIEEHMNDLLLANFKGFTH